LLGRVYEYFLTRFASAEGKNGGQFYTPSCVVRCLVEMLGPYKGRIYDPCCGSGGMFVQSEKFVESHGGKLGDISIYGQESNATTRRLAVMNLALRGIEAYFGPEHADTFRRDLHPDLRADYVLANPPFNDSDWFRKDDDVRWQFGVPPKGNANFAWVQHFIHHLAPQGMAGWAGCRSPVGANELGFRFRSSGFGTRPSFGPRISAFGLQSYLTASPATLRDTLLPKLLSGELSAGRLDEEGENI
jgi:type I restriction enzyme M protein